MVSLNLPLQINYITPKRGFVKPKEKRPHIHFLDLPHVGASFFWSWYPLFGGAEGNQQDNRHFGVSQDKRQQRACRNHNLAIYYKTQRLSNGVFNNILWIMGPLRARFVPFFPLIMGLSISPYFSGRFLGLSWAFPG